MYHSVHQREWKIMGTPRFAMNISWLILTCLIPKSSILHETHRSKAQINGSLNIYFQNTMERRLGIPSWKRSCSEFWWFHALGTPFLFHSTFHTFSFDPLDHDLMSLPTSSQGAMMQHTVSHKARKKGTKALRDKQLSCDCGWFGWKLESYAAINLQNKDNDNRMIEYRVIK